MTFQKQKNNIMKMKLPMTVASAATVLAIAVSFGIAQPQRGPQKLNPRSSSPTPAAEQALREALTGPEGEYAAQALYLAIVQQFGNISPYATIAYAEGRHIAALQRQFEMLGLAVPPNPYTSPLQLPATLKEAAELAASVEERNVAMYDGLLELVKDQPNLVKVFSNLQWASREHHLPAVEAAAANDGQVAAAGGTCTGMGVGGREGRGGSPACAGSGLGSGRQSASCGACSTGCAGQGVGKMGAGRGFGGNSGTCPRSVGSSSL
jgi:hypothetical protein